MNSFYDLIRPYESWFPYLFALGIAFPAMVMDLLEERVANTWLLFSLLAGFFLRWIMEGRTGLLLGVQGMALPLLLLFPLFLLKMLGAGDIKLLSVLGILLGREKILSCVCCAFITGAVLSLFLMLKRRILLERIRYFCSYLRELPAGKERKPYRKAGEKRPEHIHFTVPVCISLVLCTGGVI